MLQREDIKLECLRLAINIAQHKKNTDWKDEYNHMIKLFDKPKGGEDEHSTQPRPTP